MRVAVHQQGANRAVEVIDDAVLVSSGPDALSIIADPALAEATGIILHRRNFADDFFRLSTGLAGEVLQKFVTYGVRVAIVGDFSDLESDSLQAFMAESNRGGNVLFLAGVDEAARRLAGAG